VTFTYPEHANANIQIYDVTGKQLENIIDNDKNGQTQLDLTNYIPNVYLYKINTPDNLVNKNPSTTYTGKIIKE